MRLDPAPELAAPAISVVDDPFAPPPPKVSRRLRVLDVLMALAVMAAGGAIAANALLLQKGPRLAALPTAGIDAPAGESPKAAVRSTSIPLPPVSPVSHAAGAATGTLGYLASKMSVTGLVTPLKPVSAEEAAAGAIAVPKPVASQRSPLKMGGLDAGAPIRPPADVPAASSPRVLGVQRALAKLGYGPLKVNGVAGPETRQAIQRFERDRKLPVDGEISDRLVRELGAVSGLAVN